jgi:hypothetical protein
MFYQWHLRSSKFTSCYIDSVVPTLRDGLAANKSYVSSGSLARVQIWNTTTPPEHMKILSWNTRPQRIALMGTVAFLPEKEKIKQLKFEDGWQSQLPTRFPCGEDATVSIEVACDGCRIEFEQLFSSPPLGERSGVGGLSFQTDALRRFRFNGDRVVGICPDILLEKYIPSVFCDVTQKIRRHTPAFSRPDLLHISYSEKRELQLLVKVVISTLYISSGKLPLASPCCFQVALDPRHFG